jgi:hypothetical protein
MGSARSWLSASMVPAVSEVWWRQCSMTPPKLTPPDVTIWGTGTPESAPRRFVTVEHPFALR